MSSRTELSDLGEFGLISRLHSSVKQYQPSTHCGIGDDCAVLDYGGEYYTLVSTDMLLEGIHFDLSYAPLKHLGYKAVVVNLSDIAAMNGLPQQITVGLGLSNRFSVEAVEELYAGIRLACEHYKVDLVGGDTTSSRAGLVIAVSVLGQVHKPHISYRRGAKPNDILCVSGDLGAAYLGLQILEREKQVYIQNPEAQPVLAGKDYLLERQLKPEARTDLIHEFGEIGLVPTAMIDISDGLASDLLHLCKQSGVGAVIFDEKVPVDNLSYETALEFHLEPLTCALHGGEDYELLFAIAPTDFDKIKHHADITPIGYCLEDPQKIVVQTPKGQFLPITAQGWRHF